MRFVSVLLLMVFVFTTVISAQKVVSDDTIYDEVRRKLARDPDVKGAAFEVDVKAGAVTVKGTVTKEKFKEKAERLIRRTKGVKSVNNQIEVKPVGI